MDTDDLAVLMRPAFGATRFAVSDEGDTVRIYEDGRDQVMVIERSSALADVAIRLGPAPQGEALRRLLEAGCNGAGTGAGAFALDGDELLLLARLDLAAMSEGDAQTALGALMAHAAFWRQEGIPGARGPAGRSPDAEAMLLRL